MTLSTHAGLKAALARLLNRDDLAEAIPDFIALFEADFDADPRAALHRRRICRAQASIENEYESLPANYLAVQSIALASEPTIWLQYVDPDGLERMVQDKAAWQANAAALCGAGPGSPRFYTIVGAEIRLFPAPSAPLTCNLTVYERLDPLADEGDANWALTYFPQAYLYGSAIHSAPYLGADERLATWQGLYDEAMGKLSAADPTPTSKTRLRAEPATLAGRGAERRMG
jgi:hypothetical protein